MAMNQDRQPIIVHDHSDAWTIAMVVLALVVVVAIATVLFLAGANLLRSNSGSNTNTNPSVQPTVAAPTLLASTQAPLATQPVMQPTTGP